MKLLVSACLLGCNCKYNGGNNFCQNVADFARDKEVISVCPEVLAGLGTPREPIEIRCGEVVRRDGTSVDSAIRSAVAQILRELEGQEIDLAILKARSPTCGVKQVYDGTFTATLMVGNGVTADLLLHSGIAVYGESQVYELLE